MFTEEQVNEILAVCDKATEGPWEAIDIPGDVTFVYAKRPILVSDENICIDCSLSDADFIALARTALPQLAEDYRKLLAVAEAAKKVIEQYNDIDSEILDRAYALENLVSALADAGYGGEE